MSKPYNHCLAELNMKSRIGYTAIETFDPTWGEIWDKYIEWSRLDHLEEVVSLDCSLCPSIIGELIAEDWNFKVYEDIFHGLFNDLDYLIGRVAKGIQHQIIATISEPKDIEVLNFRDKRFLFKGYDLIENDTRISALTNCGGFDLAFQKSDISKSGLILSHDKAFKIRESLFENYPDEYHADCNIWAIWKMK